MNSNLKKALKIVIVLTVISFLVQLVLQSFINTRAHVKACKEFIGQNPAMKEYFGDIQKIRLGWNGYSIQKEGAHVVYGTVPFIVVGEKHKDKIKVEWDGSGGQFVIKKVTRTACFMKDDVLFPGNVAVVADCLIPYNYFDGLVELGGSFLTLLFYLDSKKKRIFTKLFFGLWIRTENGFETLSFIIAIGFVFSLVSSILTFMNFAFI